MRALWGVPPTCRHLAASRAWPRPSWSRRSRTGASRRSGSSPPTRSSRSPTRGASPPRCAAPSSWSCQDAYHPTETSALAHVVLPAAQWPEKDGTMTNSERRVALVRSALDPPGEALPDWEIFARARPRARASARRSRGESPPQVYDEYVRTTAGPPVRPDRALARAAAARGPLQWPCPRAAGRDPGHRRGCTRARRFATPDGRARLAPTPHADARRRARRRLPAGADHRAASRSQWHTMTRTGKSPSLLAAEPRAVRGAAPGRRRRAGVADGERVRVRSRRGVGDAARCGCPTRVPRGRRVRAVPLGRAAPRRPGAGALNDVTAPARRPGLASSRS